MMQISVVVPVLNEEKSIGALIQTLSKQSLHPTEVILVDGGSQDHTVERITQLQQEHLPFTLSLIEKKGANRSVARNLGIREAKSAVVALTDAGCQPKKDWLERLAKGLQENMGEYGDVKKTQVVAGFYDPDPQNWWEDILADYTCVREWNFDHKTFLPSSRSIAFTKQIWEQVGGYPEHLDTCEDLVFAENVKAKTKHWVVNKDAQVVWDQPKNLTQLSHKIYGYALGDLEAKYERHVRKIHSAMWRMIVLICVAAPGFFIGQPFIRLFALSFFLLYYLGSVFKHPRMLKYPLAFIVLPVVQLTVDSALVQALIYHKLSSRYK